MQHEVFEHDLDGAKGLVVNVPGARVTNLVVRFNSGFQFADQGAYELPHVLEHLLVAGSKTHYPRHQAFSTELQKNGAFINAYTSAAANGYVAEFANFELDRFMTLQRDYFLENLFEPQGLAAEVSNVRQELTRNTTQPGASCGISYLSAAYPDRFKPYDERIGQLDTLTPEHCRAYYGRTHTWNNLRVYLAGDFADGGQSVLQDFTEALREMPRGERLEPKRAPGQDFAPLALSRDIDQVYYNVGWFTPAVSEESWPAFVVLRSLLGEGWASRIFGKVRERGLAYHIDCGVDFDPGSCALELSGFVTADNLEPMFRLITDEMSGILQGNISEEEVKAAQNLRSGSQLRAYQTGGQLLNWYLNHYEEWGVIESFDGWVKKLQAVTKDQVVEAARHLCTGAARGSAFLGKVGSDEAKTYAALLDGISDH